MDGSAQNPLGSLFDSDAERALLAALCRRPADAAHVDPALLVELRHRTLFAALRAAGSLDSCAVVGEMLRRCPEHVAYLLDSLDEDLVDAPSPTPYIEILRRCRDRRRLASIRATMDHAIADAHGDPLRAAAWLHEVLGELLREAKEWK